LDSTGVAVDSVVVEGAQADVEVSNKNGWGRDVVQLFRQSVVEHGGRKVHSANWGVVENKGE